VNTSATSLQWFRRLAALGALWALLVVVAGAWVRLSAAGLGCPDWPGCYGHLSAESAAENFISANAAFPERPFEYHKAVKEMLHRYLASGLLLLIVVLAGLALRNRQDQAQPVKLPLFLVALVVLQALLGMWTVTLLLKPLIVVLHLLGGLATFGLLGWLAMDPARTAPTTVRQAPWLPRLAVLALLVLGAQILSGLSHLPEPALAEHGPAGRLRPVARAGYRL
jgi:heme a synthase